MELLFPGAVFFIIIPILIVTFWALIDILRNDFRGNNTKLIWVLVVLLAGPLGAILYFVIGRQEVIPKNHTHNNF